MGDAFARVCRGRSKCLTEKLWYQHKIKIRHPLQSKDVSYKVKTGDVRMVIFDPGLTAAIRASHHRAESSKVPGRAKAVPT